MITNITETIQALNAKYLRKDLPEFNVGDTIKMKIKVQEADKMRLHTFEGTVISKVGSGLQECFTVRKISFGEGVERIFPIHSPVIESLKIISKGVVKRSKLYYLRDRIGRKASVTREQVVAA